MITLDNKTKKYLGRALVFLSVTPQILFAVGAVYPPAAVAAVAVQKLISLLDSVQPGAVQGGLAAAGVALSEKVDPGGQ